MFPVMLVDISQDPGRKRKGYMDENMDAWVYDTFQVRIGNVSIPKIVNNQIVCAYQ